MPRDLDDRDDPLSSDNDLNLVAEIVMPGGRNGKRWRSRIRTDYSFEEAEQKVLDALGSGRLRASGLRNGEGDRERIPQEQWADLQFCWTTPLRELRHHLPQSVASSSRYVGPRDRLRHNATYWTNVLLQREEVLALWPDSLPDILWAKTDRVTLAEAVALLVRGRPALKKVWRRLRRRHGGGFPAAIVQEIEEAGLDIVEMLRRREITASGRPCVREGGIITPPGGMKRLDDDFLDEPLWVDPCADEIWTEFSLDDGRFNPVNGGYRDVVLKRQLSVDAVKAQGNLPQPEGAPYVPKNDAPDRADEVAATSLALQEQAKGGFSRAQLESWYRDVWIKRKEEEGKIPTRDEDWEAARSEVSSRVPRDAVRQMRREFAPASWTYRGRRKETGGN